MEIRFSGPEIRRMGEQMLKTGVFNEQMSRKYVSVAGLGVQLFQNTSQKPQERL